MEKVICPKCGKETLASFSFCKSCNEKLPDGLKPISVQQGGETTNNRRHGFITFWLWLLMVANVFSLITNFAPEWAWGRNYEAIQPAWVYYMCGVIGLIYMAGIYLLYKWRKVGFSLVVISTAICLLIYIIAGLKFSSTVYAGPIVGLIVLYGILQLKSNGVSYWKQLK